MLLGSAGASKENLNPPNHLFFLATKNKIQKWVNSKKA
jgi:hypothetical protein